MTDPSLTWLLFACRTDYAADVMEIVQRRGDTIGARVDNLDGRAIDTVAPSDLTAAQRALPTVIPLITPGYRFAVVAEAQALGIEHFPPLLDPTAVVAATARADDGTVVNAGVVIAAEVMLERFVHVNRSASIGHHSRLEDFATLGPGCVLAGRVHIGRGAFVGAGAVCAPTVTVGANAVVGAGAVVVADVAPGAVVVGNPARMIRQGETGYGGAQVPD
jgi:sugar O-acyltransferase (sialic acid O-acetyltransferase NeuD family)